MRAFKKTDREFAFFTNFWAFAQSFWDTEDTEKYHRGVLAGCDKMFKTFCCDKSGKPLDDISSLRMGDILRAFALREEHNFLNDFTRYADRFSNASTDEEWTAFLAEAEELIKAYCPDDSWESRKRRSMIVDLLFIVDDECQRKRVEELKSGGA